MSIGSFVAFITGHPVEDASGSAHAGLLSYRDLAEWHASVEEPVALSYGDLTVHKCPTWTQGPVFLQRLALLAGDDLKALGHNSPDYLHLLIESAKLAFADREAYYGDPKFDKVPMDVLLSPTYTAKRRALIEREACPHFRPGDVGQGVPPYATFNVQEDNRRALQVAGRAVRDLGLGHSHVGDTTHLDAVDRQGNMVAATPSGGWLADSPVIPGLGFPLGSRGQMVYLHAARPNALAPHKPPPRGVEGVRNVLAALGMSGDAPIVVTPRLYQRTRWVRVDDGGIFFTRRKLGNKVEMGDLLGTVTDPVTNETKRVETPSRGRIIGMAVPASRDPGLRRVSSRHRYARRGWRGRGDSRRRGGEASGRRRR